MPLYHLIIIMNRSKDHAWLKNWKFAKLCEVQNYYEKVNLFCFKGARKSGPEFLITSPEKFLMSISLFF